MIFREKLSGGKNSSRTEWILYRDSTWRECIEEIKKSSAVHWQVPNSIHLYSLVCCGTTDQQSPALPPEPYGIRCNQRRQQSGSRLSRTSSPRWGPPAAMRPWINSTYKIQRLGNHQLLPGFLRPAAAPPMEAAPHLSTTQPTPHHHAADDDRARKVLIPADS